MTDRRGNCGLAVRATPFAIPYETPLVLSAGTVVEHCAVLVELFDGQTRGFGEIAPGPGTSRTDALSMADRVAELSADIELFARAVAEDFATAQAISIPLDVRPGIEAAILDLAARRRRETIASFLGGSRSDSVSVSVNAMIDRASPDAARRAVDDAVGRGYRCLKIKVAPSDFEQCRALLRHVRERHAPAITLRIDCNGEWPVAAARAAMTQLEDFDIEYVEQPTHTLEELRELRFQTSIPIAADESACNLEQIERAIALDAVDVFVLKPARLGPLTSLRAAARAREAGADCVVTSNLDTSLGVAHALQIASLIDARNPDRAYAHGLGTVELLAGDITETRLVPREGVLRRPTADGCGVTPAATEIERWCIRR